MKKRLLFILCLTCVAAGSSFAQTRTVTNRDLEKFRQKRVEAEREYRENYEKLGFPSPEELERQREQNRYETEEILQRQREQRLETESDFRAQARLLSAEIASIEAQINYVNSLLPANQAPIDYFTGGIAPFGYNRNGRSNSIWRGDATGRLFFGGGGIYTPNPRSAFGNFPRSAPLGNVYRPNRVPGNRGGIGVSIGGGNFNSRGRLGNNYPRGYRRNNQLYGYYAPVIVDKYDYTQDELIVQLRSLAQVRSGLYAEWRLLQEEAHRAGVKLN
ncbi:MAG TPA: hypothetical protein VF692_12410 [Pyrinomonadaceae bacterium]|jgi:hypothetical protein